MKLRSAKKSDLAAVEQLLGASDLPIDGVRDNFDNFVVAEEDGTIAGAVGLEKYGAFGLLRSAVVSPRYRSGGVGRQLVERLLARAEEAGVDEVYLLTTTAEDYFPKFGFSRTTRTAVPEAVKASAEFRGACPDTAIVMSRRIGAPTRNS